MHVFSVYITCALLHKVYRYIKNAKISENNLHWSAYSGFWGRIFLVFYAPRHDSHNTCRMLSAIHFHSDSALYT